MIRNIFAILSSRPTCGYFAWLNLAKEQRVVGLWAGGWRGVLGGSTEGGSSVNDRHSSVCERRGTPSHAAPGSNDFQLLAFPFGKFVENG